MAGGAAGAARAALRGAGARGCGGRRRRLRLGAGVGFDVLLGDAAAGSGAFHLREIEIEVAGHFADQRREGSGGFFRGGFGLGFGGGRLDGRRGRRGCGRVGRRKRLPHVSGRGCRGGLGSGLGGSGATSLIDARDYGVDAYRLAFLHENLGEGAGGRRRNLGVHLVGGDLKERLIALDALAGLFEPFGQGAFHNAFAHLGHDDVGHISSHFRVASGNRIFGRSERRVLRPPLQELHGHPGRPWRSRAGSIRRERCTENRSGRWTR